MARIRGRGICQSVRGKLMGRASDREMMIGYSLLNDLPGQLFSHRVGQAGWEGRMGYKVTGPGDNVSTKNPSRELASSKPPRLGQAAQRERPKGTGAKYSTGGQDQLFG